jgi:hypothetical protein
MRETIGFFTTIALSLILILFIGKKRKSTSRYERTPHAANDWQKLDRGIDPTE